jgi:hypothetical protein
VPGAPAGFHAGFEQRELVCPRREAAGAAKGVELAEDRHQRVVGRLRGEVLDVGRGEVGELAAPAAELEACGAQQQRVQVRERRLAHAGGPAQRRDPHPGVVREDRRRMLAGSCHGSSIGAIGGVEHQGVGVGSAPVLTSGDQVIPSRCGTPRGI